MNQITRDARDALIRGYPFRRSNTRVERRGDRRALIVHGNEIAFISLVDSTLHITNAGWPTQLTRNRLNALPGVSITQRNFKWYLNGEPWDGSWTQVAQMGESWDFRVRLRNRTTGALTISAFSIAQAQRDAELLLGGPVQIVRSHPTGTSPEADGARLGL